MPNSLLRRRLAVLPLAIGAATDVKAAYTDPAAPKVNASGCNRNGVRVLGADQSGAIQIPDKYRQE